MRLSGFVTGFVLCFLISLSSLYSAMRFGILAWPTLFVTIVCFAIMSIFGTKDLKEITLSHTLASSGSMVAGAIAYTLPCLWLGGVGVFSFAQILFAVILGVSAGAFFSFILYKPLVPNIDYPIGKAAYLTLTEIGDKDVNKRHVFVPVGVSSVFSFVRDFLKKIPETVTLATVGGLQPVQMWLSFVPMAIGALLSPVIVALWFTSAVVFLYIVTPLFSAAYDIAMIKEDVSFALMLGSGIGILLRSFVKNRRSARTVLKNYSNRKYILVFFLHMLVFVIVSTILFGINPLVSLVLFFAAFLATYLASRLTGESGINPMEVLSFISLIIVGFFTTLSPLQAFSILVCVTVSTGLAGDMMNDLKSGCLMGVDYRKQIALEFLGALIGAVVSVIVVFSFAGTSGFFDSMSVPQARMLSSMIIKKRISTLFVVVFLLSIVLSFFNISSSVMGLGIYLPFNITISVAIGALAGSCVPSRLKKQVPLFASGLLTGEGITAVVISFIVMCL